MPHASFFWGLPHPAGCPRFASVLWMAGGPPGVPTLLKSLREGAPFRLLLPGRGFSFLTPSPQGGICVSCGSFDCAQHRLRLRKRLWLPYLGALAVGFDGASRRKTTPIASIGVAASRRSLCGITPFKACTPITAP